MPEVVVSSRETYKRDKPKYQRTKRELYYLPFYDQLDCGAHVWLQQIKTGLVTSTSVYAVDAALVFWFDQLGHYIDALYLRFTREDHIRFIRFTYEVVLERDLDHKIVHKACSLIKSLVNEEILTRKDVTLEWRPLYDLYTEVAFGRNSRSLDVEVIKDVALAVKEYFALSATSEILAQIRPYIDTWNDYAMERFIGLFAMFVPLNMSLEDHRKHGSVLWFDELWHLYNMVEMNSSWECRIQCIFSAISAYCPGCIDWTPKHTIIFSKLLRTMNLSVRDGKVSVGDGAGMGSETAGAEWIIWMLGGPNDSAERHLCRLIRCIESFLHPLHDGLHTLTLQSFLAALVREMVLRVRIERVRNKTKNKVPKWMRLSDKQVESFVSMLLPSLKYSAFSTMETSIPSYILRYLAFLAPNLVLPRVLDLVYPSLSTVTEPNRLVQSLECLVEICVPLVRDDDSHKYESFFNCKRDWIAELHRTYQSRERLVSTAFCKKEKGVTESNSESTASKESSRERQTLRHHAVVLLDALVSAIDINDIVKLSLAFRTVESLLTLIPVVDCSSAINMEQYKTLSEEEKRVCSLTATLPKIVTKLMHRVFTLIEQLGTAVPKDSTSSMDSICELSLETTYGNEDEMVVNARMQSVFRTLLNNSSHAVVEMVAEQVYNFVRRIQTENAIAADAMCALVQECTYADPEKYFPLYLNHVLKNLKELISEEKRNLEVLDAATMWFIYLGMVLFSVPSHIIMKHRKECFDLHKLVISMKCCNAYQGACWSLTNALTQLTEVYPLSGRDQRRELDAPLSTSLSIQKWGRVVVKENVNMRWHVPDDNEVQFAEQLINEFVYKEIVVLNSPEDIDKKAMKRCLSIIERLLFCVGKRLPNFDTPVVVLSEAQSQLEARVLSAMPDKMKTFSFHGENTREQVRKTMRKLIEHLVRLNDDQSKNLERVISILYYLTTRASASQFRVKQEDSGLNYEDPIKGKRAELYKALEDRVFTLQKEIRPKSTVFTTSHLEILKDLVLLGTNSFTAVRISAQAVLIRILSKFPNAKARIVKDVVKYLEPAHNSCHEEIKGALYMLLKGGFVVSNAMSVRCRCWLAIVKVKYSEKPSIISLVERTYTMVSADKWSPATNVISDSLRNRAHSIFSDAQSNSNSPNPRIANNDLISATKLKFNERRERREKWTDTLRRELIRACQNKGQLYHWRNVDCARAFLFTFYRDNFNTDALKVFLQMLTDDREAWRQAAVQGLGGWMEWNKPKSIRMQWDPPHKVQETENRYACGMRMDNLCILYNEKCLPSDDDSWNRTIFVPKPHWGSYQWPKTLTVCAPFPTQKNMRRTLSELNEMERLAVSSLLEGGIFKQWHAVLLKDKEDNDQFSTAEFMLIKYLFRNFHTILLPLMRTLLEDLLKKSTEGTEDFLLTRARKRLAAVYCSGLINGSRNWAFSELNSMWSWLKPLMMHQIEGLTSETAEHWETALKLCVDYVDLRRVYWLVEGIFEVALKPPPTSWHACLRLSFVHYISTCSTWRTTSLLRRALNIAKKLIRTASLATQRDEVARILSFPTVFAFVVGSQRDLPQRFVIPSLDEIMLSFSEETKVMTESTMSLDAKSSQSPDENCNAAINVAMKIKSGTLDNPKKLLGLKTLLGFVNVYYRSAYVALSPPMIALFPLFTHLANEETTDNEEAQEVGDVDVAIGSNVVLFQTWSGIYLREDLADIMLNTVNMTMLKSDSWKAWVSILRFLQVFIFSNVFVCERNNRPLIIRGMMEKALRHYRIEVRNEAAECLTSFVHCGHQPIQRLYIDEAFHSASSTVLPERHGAILKLSSVIRAYPFTIPPMIVDLVLQYCAYWNNNDSVVKSTITETLRSFLRTHHDKLAERCEEGSAKTILDAVHNVISPNYYV